MEVHKNTAPGGPLVDTGRNDRSTRVAGMPGLLTFSGANTNDLESVVDLIWSDESTWSSLDDVCIMSGWGTFPKALLPSGIQLCPGIHDLLVHTFSSFGTHLMLENAIILSTFKSRDVLEYSVDLVYNFE